MGTKPESTALAKHQLIPVLFVYQIKNLYLLFLTLLDGTFQCSASDSRGNIKCIYESCPSTATREAEIFKTNSMQQPTATTTTGNPL
eukprot:4443346-Ditylum_brightwellii.AAC.1